MANKTMFILVDTGSSHSFVSSHFVNMVSLPTVPMPQQKVKLANGEWLHTTRKVPNLQWFIQGHTFQHDMIVLDMLPYDAILGYDWLKANSPMQCDWLAKTLQFTHKGKHVAIKGITSSNILVTHISPKQLYKSSQGNDIWTYVILDKASPNPTEIAKEHHKPKDLKLLLDLYADVFQDP